MIRILGQVFLFLALSGCAMLTSPPDFTQISHGMSKKDVIQNLGTPDSTSFSAGKEYLKYVAGKGTISRVCFSCKEYYVRLKDGKVESYGSSGDGNSREDLSSNSYDDANASGNAMLQNMARQPASAPVYFPSPSNNTEPSLQNLKQIDYKCMNNCTSNGYNRNLCQSKCEY